MSLIMYNKQRRWVMKNNPTYANTKLSNSNLSRTAYTVKFVTKGYSSTFDNALKNSFKLKHVDQLKRWSFDASSLVFSYSFI